MTSDTAPRTHVTPGVRKFFLLNLVTLGSYQAYWGWKNWEIVKRARSTKDHTSVRGFFILFSSMWLFPQIQALAKEAGYRDPFKYSYGLLAGAFLVLTFLSNRLTSSPHIGLGMTVAIWAAGSFIVTLVVTPVLRAMRYYTEHTDKPTETFKFKTNWALIIAVSATWLLFLIVVSYADAYRTN